MSATRPHPAPGLQWKDIILPTPSPSREPSRARPQQQSDQFQETEPTPPLDPTERLRASNLASAQVQRPRQELRAEVEQEHPAEQPVRRGPERPRKRKLSPSARYPHVKVRVVPTAAQAEYLRRHTEGQEWVRTAVPTDRNAVNGVSVFHQNGVQVVPNTQWPSSGQVNCVGYVQPHVGVDQLFFARAQHQPEQNPSHDTSQDPQAMQSEQQQQPPARRVVRVAIPDASKEASDDLLKKPRSSCSSPPIRIRQVIEPQTLPQQLAQTKTPPQPRSPDTSSPTPDPRSTSTPLIRSTRKRQPKPSLKARENAELEEERVSLVSQQSRVGSRSSEDKADEANKSSGAGVVKGIAGARDKGKGVAEDSLAPVHMDHGAGEMGSQSPGSDGVDFSGARAKDLVEAANEPFPLLGVVEEGEMVNGHCAPVQLITGEIVDPSFVSYFQARGEIAESTEPLCHHHRQRQHQPKPKSKTQTQTQTQTESGPERQPKPKPKSNRPSYSRPRCRTHTPSQHPHLPCTTTRWWILGLKTFTEYNPHAGTSSDRVILRSGVEPNTLAYWFDRALYDVASYFGRTGSVESVVPEICLGLLRARDAGDVGKMVWRGEVGALVVKWGQGGRAVGRVVLVHQVYVKEDEVVVAVVRGEEPEYGTKVLITAEGEFVQKTVWDVLLDEVKVEAKEWKDFRRYKAFEALKSYARLAKLEYISREAEGRLNPGHQPANAIATRWMRKVEIEKVVPPGRVLRSKALEEKMGNDGRLKMKMIFAQFRIPRTVGQDRAETRLKLKQVNAHILDRAEARLKLSSLMAQIRDVVRRVD